MPRKLRGSASIYVLLILAGIIGMSYLINDGVLPIFTADNKIRKVVSKVTIPDSKEESGLQLKTLGYDPRSVTVMPTSTLLTTLPTGAQPSGSVISVTPTPSQKPGGLSSGVASESPTPTETVNLSPTSTTKIAPTLVSVSPTKIVTTPAKPSPTPSSTSISSSSELPPLTSFQKKILALLRSQKGEHYHMGACENWYSSSNRPSNPPKQSDACIKWDCSNFVAWVYYWATDGSFRMHSQTCADYGNCYNISGGFSSENPNLYTKYSYKDLGKIRFGDLVYFGSNKDAKYPTTSHVGMYIGKYGNCGADDCIIDASASGGGVSERRLAKVPHGVVGFLRPKV